MYLCHVTINPIDYERRILNQVDTAVRLHDRVDVYALGRPGDAGSEFKKHFSTYRLTTRFYRGGPLKFLSFNLQLICRLLRREYTLIHCHDLWVLPAAAVVSWLRKTEVIYDAHEYYAGLEVFNRKRLSRVIWMLAERIAITRVQVVLTVSEKLGQHYRARYPRLRQIEIIRNLPRYEELVTGSVLPVVSGGDQKILIYQGHFKPGRGLENLIRAVAITPEVNLVMIGNGELETHLKNLVRTLDLRDRVWFKDFVPLEQLLAVSAQGDIGIALFEPTSLNYAAALPNKFFEYVMAGLAVLSSTIETFSFYISKYDLGQTVDPGDIEAISRTIRSMIADEDRLRKWKTNAGKAARELNWENEEKKLIEIYARFRK